MVDYVDCWWCGCVVVWYCVVCVGLKFDVDWYDCWLGYYGWFFVYEDFVLLVLVDYVWVCVCVGVDWCVVVW